MGLSPSIPNVKAPPRPPSLIDPLVQYARMRQKQKAATATGRASTILASGTPAPQQKLSSTTTAGAY